MGSLEIVDPRVADYLVRSRIIDGFHELHLYAIDHWLDHLQGLGVQSVLDEQHLLPLRQSLERLTGLHNHLALLKQWNTEGKGYHVSQVDQWHTLGLQPTVQHFLEGLLAYQDKAFVKGGSTVNLNGVCMRD